MLTGNRLAIIIGINEYRDRNIKELPGAEYDAMELYGRLRNPDIGNFKTIYYLVGQEATCEKIRRAINDAFWKTDHYDLVLFYFSGHGFVDGYGEGYIAPYDMSMEEPFTCGINMRELRNIVSNSKGKDSVVTILDCCHSGIAAKGDKDLSDPKIIRENFEKHLKMSGQNRITLASSQANEKSREIDVSSDSDNSNPHHHGRFTFYLLEGMDGPASDENTGIITLARLQEYVGKKVTETGTEQNPIFSFGTEVGQLEGMEIAVIPQIWRRNRDALLQQISESSKVDQIETLYDAAKKIKDQLPRFDPDKTHLDNFKNSITGCLQKYSGRITTWLDDNNIIIGSKIGIISPGLYDHLYDFEDYLNFDRILTMDPVELRRLAALCAIINVSITPETFIRRLTPPKSSSSNRVSYSGRS
jgi:hypothetical protein